MDGVGVVRSVWYRALENIGTNDMEDTVEVETILRGLQTEHAKALSLATSLESAIKALGGTVGEPRKRRSRGGWPKGKLRGTKASSEAPSAKSDSPIATARAKRAAKGGNLAAAAAAD